MGKRTLSRDNRTVVEALDDGRKLSVSDTAAGPRINLHDGPITRPVSPEEANIARVHASTVGGGGHRVTIVHRSGEATDITQGGYGGIDEQIHNGGTTRKP